MIAIGIPVIINQVNRLRNLAQKKYGENWREYNVSHLEER